MKDGGGHIVLLTAMHSEFLDGREDVAEKIERRITGVAAADILHAGQAKLRAVNIVSFGQAIGAKQQGIAGLKRESKLIIAHAGVKPQRDARESDYAAFLPAQKKRSKHAGAGHPQFGSRRIKEGILKRGVTCGDAAQVQSLVE